MRTLTTLCAIAVLGGAVGSRVFAAEEHAAVGSDKCAKVCHKVQLKSWAESKHAKAEKKTECETCHGNGADYMKLPVMKDPAKAEAAGLIAKPAVASCKTCHENEITEAMLAEVHEHKAKK